MNIFRHRGGLLATLLLLTAVGLSCVEGPLDPVMPTTDTEFNIPILDQISTFADVAVQGPIVNNGNGTISYISSQELKPMGVDSISVQPRSTSEQVSIGQFTVAVPARTDSLSATDLGFPPGTYPVGIPAGQTALAPRNLDMTDSIGYVAVASGTLTLQVRNTLPIPISLPKGLGIKNNSTVPFDTTTIGTFDFGLPISPGQTRTASVNLAGKIIRGQLQTDSVVFSTTGSGGSNVTVGATDGLFFAFSSTGLQADSAGARIPDQTIATYPPGSLFTVDDSVVIQTADFRRGRFTIRFTNTTDVGVNMAVRITELISTVTGQSFNLAKTVAKHSVIVDSVSVATLRISTTPAALGTTLTFSGGINTIGSGAALATITRNDFVRVELIPSGSLAVKSILGRIKPMRLNVNLAQRSAFDLGELATKMAGSFIFDSVKIKLRLPMTGGFPTDYNLKIFVKNTARGILDSVDMPAIGTQKRVFPKDPTRNTIVLDKSTRLDSVLGKFFPVVPDSFFVRGSLVLNPIEVFNEGVNYDIADTSKVYPGIDLDFPARFGLLNGSLRSVDPLKSKSGEDLIPKDITKSVKQASLNVEATNGFPVQMSFRMNFIGLDTLGVRDTLLRIAPSALIQAAQVDANGYPVSPRVTSFQVLLTNADMLNLNRADSVAVRVDLQTSGGGTAPVQFRSFDRLRLRASGRIIYTINKP